MPKLKPLFPPGFTVYSMEYIKRRNTVLRHPEYKKAIKNNHTTRFYKELDQRAKGKSHILLSIFGDTDSGKSWATIWIALFIVNKTKSKAGFGIANIGFNATEIKRKLNALLRKYGEKGVVGTFLMRDELSKERGEGSIAREEELTDIQETCREKKISFASVGTTIRTRTNHYILETWAIDVKRKLCMLIIHDNEANPLGYIIVNKPPNSILKPYQELKRKNMNMMLSGAREKAEFWKDLARTLIRDKDFINSKTIRQKKLRIIEKHPTLTMKERDYVLEYANPKSPYYIGGKRK